MLIVRMAYLLLKSEKNSKKHTFLGLKLTKQNDLYQEIQFLMELSFHSVFRVFHFLEIVLVKGRFYRYKNFSNFLTDKKRFCLIVSHLRMFVIWSEQSWNQSMLYCHNGPRNIAREL